MRSPILTLEEAIARSAFQIAPERAEELQDINDLKGFSLRYTDDKEFNIRINMVTHEAILPIATLEYIWCCAHAFDILFKEYRAAQQSGAKEFDWLKVARANQALDLLNWSLDNMDHSGVGKWPSNVPAPSANPPEGSDVHAANELFLCAIAWLIHHETAHVILNHGVAQAAFPVQKEREADLYATDWILSASNVAAETVKRSLGIATAILSMQLLDRPGSAEAYARTHPPSVERLDYCLDKAGAIDDGVVCGFAAVVLQFHLSQWHITASLDGSSMRDLLRGFMAAFATAKP